MVWFLTAVCVARSMSLAMLSIVLFKETFIDSTPPEPERNDTERYDAGEIWWYQVRDNTHLIIDRINHCALVSSSTNSSVQSFMCSFQKQKLHVKLFFTELIKDFLCYVLTLKGFLIACQIVLAAGGATMAIRGQYVNLRSCRALKRFEYYLGKYLPQSFAKFGASSFWRANVLPNSDDLNAMTSDEEDIRSGLVDAAPMPLEGLRHQTPSPQQLKYDDSNEGPMPDDALLDADTGSERSAMRAKKRVAFRDDSEGMDGEQGGEMADDMLRPRRMRARDEILPSSPSRPIAVQRSIKLNSKGIPGIKTTKSLPDVKGMEGGRVPLSRPGRIPVHRM